MKTVRDHDAELHVLECYESGLRNGYADLSASIGNAGDVRDYLGLSQAGACRRKVSFGLSPVPRPPISASTMAIFKDGYLLEADTLTRLICGGCALHSTGTPIHPPEIPEIRGHRDTMMHLDQPGGDGDEFLVEVKSMRGFPQQKLLGKKGRGENAIYGNVSVEHAAGWVLESHVTKKTNPDYYAQVQAYLYGMSFGTEETDAALIIYRMKEDGRIAVERISMDRGYGRELWSRMEGIWSAHESETLEGRDYEPAVDWQCKYCDYTGDCQGLAAGAVGYDQLNITQEA